MRSDPKSAKVLRHDFSPPSRLLEELGWRKGGTSPGRYDTWENESPALGELIIPTDPSRGDYLHLVHRVWALLASLHGAESLNRMVATSGNAFVLDSTRWKKETSFPSGLIDWSGGESLYGAAKLQLIAAAKSCKDPRPYHRGANAYVAKRFLDKSFMGQTDAGSFIITAHTPHDDVIYFSKSAEDPRQNPMGQDKSVRGHEIMETFDRSLEVVKSALEEYMITPRIAIFQEAFLEGVSYEMTKALAQFVAGSESAIEMERSSASSSKASITEISFDPPDAVVLEKAANAFLRDPDARKVVIRGEVTDLSRNLDFDKRIIRLEAPAGSAARKVRLRLNESQYEEAQKAHHDEVPLEVAGTLERDGGRYWIYAPDHVSAVEVQPIRPDYIQASLPWDKA